MAGEEATIERKVCELALRDYGIKNIKLTVSHNGWPDRMFLIPGGKPLFIEFKRPGGLPEPLQAHIHEMLKKLKYEVQVHDNVKSAISGILAAMEAAWVPEKGSKVPVRARLLRSLP